MGEYLLDYFSAFLQREDRNNRQMLKGSIFYFCERTSFQISWAALVVGGNQVVIGRIFAGDLEE